MNTRSHYLTSVGFLQCICTELTMLRLPRGNSWLLVSAGWQNWSRWIVNN